MRFLVIILMLLGALACGDDRPPSKKVLLIGLDGVRVDILDEAYTPHIDSLIANGFFGEARVREPTVSGPGWSSMLTGVWPDKHRVYSNEFMGNAYDVYPDFLTRFEQLDSTVHTFAVIDWLPLATSTSGGPLLSVLVDSIVVMDGYDIGWSAADSASTAAASDYLATSDVDAAFVYLGAIDEIGHETSSLAPEYRAAIEKADEHVGQLLDAIARRPTYGSEDWLVLSSSDHGRRDDGGHGESSERELTIFFLASGPSVHLGEPSSPPGVVDVAVTALTYLDVAIAPTWGLDGRVAGLRR